MTTLTSLLPDISIIFACGIGAILFYIFEYLAKKKMADFSFPRWFSENWFKIFILSPLCLIAWVKWMDAGITEPSAFLVGMSVSTIIDRLQDIFTGNKK